MDSSGHALSHRRAMCWPPPTTKYERLEWSEQSKRTSQVWNDEVPRSHIPKLAELLKEKIDMACASFKTCNLSTKWQFEIQELDLVSMNLPSRSQEGLSTRLGYDQFQLPMKSRDITTPIYILGCSNVCYTLSKLWHIAVSLVRALENKHQVCKPSLDCLPSY